ncbi:hypothetical protein [Streptomyces acidicola]|uniref:Uncharacterized protein n=1 Tax=Streptomyces acidicola TaxID=2596892 RepID=A0A5N8WHZ1_9ACTN|nr:hypothetical protein [Streptomyces acidicola]MPY47070.1 hypothetical protein [Streptomyces acidicola]MPY47209.1 hypothetical protein [Streptomyces acidicola]
MSALNLTDMTLSFRALETIAETHPHLPAALFHLRGTTLAAEQVIDVQFHHDPDAFTAWCDVFDIDTALLETRSTGFGHYTRAVVRYAGVTFVLVLDHHDREWRTAPLAVAA